jgi:hypothetical protein
MGSGANLGVVIENLMKLGRIKSLVLLFALTP